LIKQQQKTKKNDREINKQEQNKTDLHPLGNDSSSFVSFKASAFFVPHTHKREKENNSTTHTRFLIATTTRIVNMNKCRNTHTEKALHSLSNQKKKDLRFCFRVF